MKIKSSDISAHLHGNHPVREFDAEDYTLFASEPILYVFLPMGFESNIYAVHGTGLCESDACEAVFEWILDTKPDFVDSDDHEAWDRLEESLEVRTVEIQPDEATEPQFTLPTIHLNGTSKRMLCEGYDAAAKALHEFMISWGAIEFNARDYYPVLGAWTKACDEREVMCRHMHEIKAYLDEIRTHIHS